MTVRTLTLQSSTQTSQYWVNAVVDLPNDSTCNPADYTIVADGSGQSILFNWIPGTSATIETFATAFVPSTSGEYLNIYVAKQDTNHKGTLSYNNPIQR